MNDFLQHINDAISIKAIFIGDNDVVESIQSTAFNVVDVRKYPYKDNTLQLFTNSIGVITVGFNDNVKCVARGKEVAYFFKHIQLYLVLKESLPTAA